MPEAKTHAELYHRHGEADASKWDEAEAVTGRDVDPAPENSTFAERAKRAGGNKAVQSADAKATDDEDAPKKAAPRKSTAKRKG